MTTTHTRLDLDRPPTISHRDRLFLAGSSDDRNVHLLRLVLDLQLDALLLALGAAAAEGVKAPSDVRGETLGGIPWHRWVSEDVDLTRELASEAMSGGAALPAVLGPETAAQDRQIVLESLAARYESMRELLSDLLARMTAAQADSPASVHAAAGRRDFDTLEHNPLRHVLAHCQTRLLELRGLLDRPAPLRARTAGMPERGFLPGELLG